MNNSPNLPGTEGVPRLLTFSFKTRTVKGHPIYRTHSNYLLIDWLVDKVVGKTELKDKKLAMENSQPEKQTSWKRRANQTTNIYRFQSFLQSTLRISLHKNIIVLFIFRSIFGLFMTWTPGFFQYWGQTTL